MVLMQWPKQVQRMTGNFDRMGGRGAASGGVLRELWQTGQSWGLLAAFWPVFGEPNQSGIVPLDGYV